MSIKIRKRKNLERCTEISYATIPLEEAKEIDEKQVRSSLESFYGPSVNYDKLAEEIKQFSKSLGSQRYREFIPIEDNKKNPSEEGRDYITLKIMGKKSPRILITPTSLVHDMWHNHHRFDTTRFGALMGIVKNGFNSFPDRDNALVKKQKNHHFNWNDWSESNIKKDKGDKITLGDRYSIEMYPDKGQDFGNHFLGQPTYGVIKAKPEKMLSINIGINPDSTQEEKERKMEFYKNQITKKYHLPVRFYESNWGEKIPVQGNEKAAFIGKRIFPKKSSAE